jgi:hypothetical protein
MNKGFPLATWAHIVECVLADGVVFNGEGSLALFHCFECQADIHVFLELKLKSAVLPSLKHQAH